MLTMEFFGRLAHHVKATPSRKCTKSYSNSALKYKLGDVLVLVPLLLNILNFGILNFRGKTTDLSKYKVWQ